jgi:hypothetical protein
LVTSSSPFKKRGLGGFLKVLKGKNMQTAKQAAKQIIDHVSGQATWDDIMYKLYVKQKIEKGLKAVDEGRILSSEDAKRRLLGNEN